MQLTAWNTMTGIKAERLASTEGLPREEWLKVRRGGIGGSDIAAIASVNPWRSPMDVWLDKTGKVEPINENEKMKWGKILEEPVADEYSIRTGKKVQRVNAILRGAKPHYLANLDRLILGNGHGNGILEVKTTGWAQAWDQIPDHYMTQCQWYMAITGLQWSQMAVLMNGQELMIPDPIMRDEKVIEAMFSIADRFWDTYVVRDVPPDPTCPADKESYRDYYKMTDEAIALDAALAEQADRRKQLQQIIKAAQAEKDTIEAKFYHAIGEAKSGTCGAWKVSRTERNSSRVDYKAILADNPSINEANYTSQSISSYLTFTQKKGT